MTRGIADIVDRIRGNRRGIVGLRTEFVPDEDPAIDLLAPQIDASQPVKVGRLDHLMRVAHLIHDDEERS